MSGIDLQRQFLQSATFAVAGASADRAKYGNIVLRAISQLIQADPDRRLFAINPNVESVEGVDAYASLHDLPETPRALSIVTPPAITGRVVQDAVDLGVDRIWMQPGAEDDRAIEMARRSGITVIAGGPCLLVAIKTLGA